MMKLPEKFQMRHNMFSGFTHVVEVKGGTVRVKWARGYAENAGFILNSVFTLSEAEYYVQNGLWIVVEDKKVEQRLPDEFFIKSGVGNIWRVVEVKGGYNFYMEDGGLTVDSPLNKNFVKETLAEGHWKIVENQPLTPEQLRSNAEFREQIAALDHSIRLAHQDIEHKQKLINSYLARQGELSSKLVKET